MSLLRKNANDQSSNNSHILPDVLRHSLKLVFCGMAAGDKSAKLKAYYAGPGNKFWPVIHEIGLTPVKLEPSQYKEMLSHDIGFTDLVKSGSGMDSNITFNRTCREILHEKILNYQPQILCFNGKNAAKKFLNRKVDYGFQTERIGKTKLYVVPSTSGAANGFWDINWWYELADSV